MNGNERYFDFYELMTVIKASDYKFPGSTSTNFQGQQPKPAAYGTSRFPYTGLYPIAGDGGSFFHTITLEGKPFAFNHYFSRTNYEGTAADNGENIHGLSVENPIVIRTPRQMNLYWQQEGLYTKAATNIYTVLERDLNFYTEQVSYTSELGARIGNESATEIAGTEKVAYDNYKDGFWFGGTKTFYGTFDGQGHTLTLTSYTDLNYTEYYSRTIYSTTSTFVGKNVFAMYMFGDLKNLTVSGLYDGTNKANFGNWNALENLTNNEINMESGQRGILCDVQLSGTIDNVHVTGFNFVAATAVMRTNAGRAPFVGQMGFYGAEKTTTNVVTAINKRINDFSGTFTGSYSAYNMTATVAEEDLPVIKNSSSSDNLVGKHGRTGAVASAGFVGAIYGGTIDNCASYNNWFERNNMSQDTGYPDVSNIVGGFVGIVQGGTAASGYGAPQKIVITNCMANNATLYGTEGAQGGIEFAAGATGGFVGRIYGTMTDGTIAEITNCYSIVTIGNAMVRSASGYKDQLFGAFVGTAGSTNTKIAMENCYGIAYNLGNYVEERANYPADVLPADAASKGWLDATGVAPGYVAHFTCGYGTSENNGDGYNVDNCLAFDGVDFREAVAVGILSHPQDPAQTVGNIQNIHDALVDNLVGTAWGYVSGTTGYPLPTAVKLNGSFIHYSDWRTDLDTLRRP